MTTTPTMIAGAARAIHLTGATRRGCVAAARGRGYFLFDRKHAEQAAADYARAHGDRPIFGPGGVGRDVAAAIYAAAVADIEWAADQYAQFCADDAFSCAQEG